MPLHRALELLAITGRCGLERQISGQPAALTLEEAQNQLAT